MKPYICWDQTAYNMYPFGKIFVSDCLVCSLQQTGIFRSQMQYFGNSNILKATKLTYRYGILWIPDLHHPGDIDK